MEKEKHFENYLAQETELKSGRYVFLNVYHISKLNYFLRIFGLGLYHTTLEIDDLEYSFGGTEDEFSGIYINKKNEPIGNLVLKEKILLGFTVFSDKKLLNTLNIHSEFWLGKSYDPFKKNCNDFTRFMAQIIVKNFVANYPLYINRSTEFGFFFYCFYTPIKILYGDSFFANNKQSVLENYNLRQEIYLKNAGNISLNDNNNKRQQQYTEVPKNEDYNNTDNNKENNNIDGCHKPNQSIISKKSRFKTNKKINGTINSKISDSNNGFISELYFEEKNDEIINMNNHYDNKENNTNKPKGPIADNIGAKINARKRNSMNQDSIMVLERFINKFYDKENKNAFKSSSSIIEINKNQEDSCKRLSIKKQTQPEANLNILNGIKHRETDGERVTNHMKDFIV